MKEKYFAASNSKKGFVSYYGDAFGSAERVYIIKGGPGTGKSYFMKQVASAAERSGYSVVYTYCSSDPESLDGILIDRRVALLDGTAPHAVEASLPGVRDELLDLGRFWRSDLLSKHFERVEALSKEKSLCYRRAYDCLAAAGDLSDAAERLIAPYVLSEKLNACVARILKALPDGKEYKKTELATNSIGMRGERRFSTLEERANTVFFVNGMYGTAHIFLNAIIAEAERKKLSIRISRDPLMQDRPDAVELCGELLFTSYKTEAVKALNMSRFLNMQGISEIKKEYKALKVAESAALECAKTALSGAAESHFALEDIYIACMDFEAKEKFTKCFIKELLLALK